jgi:4-hydroxybenzoate polyprenyltransferase
MLKYFDYLFFLRPVLMPPVWTILLLGHHRSSQLNGNSHLPGLALLLITFLVGAVYILNQIFDIESDRLNRKLFFLAQGYISIKSAIYELVLLDLAAIVPAFIISWQLGILFTIGMAFGFLYSTPPINLKNRPISGLAINSLAHGNLAFLIGWCMNSTFALRGLYFSLPYMLAVGAIYLNTTIPDMEGDKRIGKLTLSVKWGKGKTLILSSILVAIAIFLSILVKDVPFLIASSLSFPFFVFCVFNKTERHIVSTTKLSILLLSIAAGFFYLWYFAVLIVGFIGTRLYYKARFNLDYPTLI